MAGTKEGGAKSAATNKKLHGDDFYQKIGAKGGKKGHTGGFYANRELARTAGAKGGRKSRRGTAKDKAIKDFYKGGNLDWKKDFKDGFDLEPKKSLFRRLRIMK